MKNCENCGNEHDGSYGSGRFCSVKCARGFSTKEKRSLINEKISTTINGSGNNTVKKICLNCKEKFEVPFNKRNQKCCSKTCSISYSNKIKWKDKDYKNKMSNLAKERHINNENFGWQTRKKFSMSYPEIIADKKLKELGIDFIHDHKVGKYFIDFAIINKKIAIEIDGQQHNLPDRKKSDNKKDNFLKLNNWKIFRIKFPEDNINKEIEKIILEVYPSW